MSQYRDGFYDLLPSWLSTDDGERVAFSLNVLLDAARERVRLGLLARFPDFAPDDAIGAIGRDRKIVRGIEEPKAAYAVRLKRWLTDHLVRGNPWALLDQLHGYLQADCVLRTVDRRGNWYTRNADGTRIVTRKAGNWDWDGAPASPRWARFWVIIYPVDGVSPWPDIAAWGGWAETGTATPEQVAAIRRIVREWKPAGTRCEWIIVSYAADAFDPSFPPLFGGMPDGHWGGFNYDEAGAGSEPIRLDTARYWRGVNGA